MREAIEYAQRELNRGVEPHHVTGSLGGCLWWTGSVGGWFACSDSIKRTVTIHGHGQSTTVTQAWWSRMLRRRGRKARH